MRMGYGYDSHAFTAGDHIILGGVKITFEKGIKAHSDGDVLLHAIGDALLGAAALGDLGKFFPDQDIAYKNVSSSKLIEKICAMLLEKNYRVVNIDSTIITEGPKLLPHIPAMRKYIAHLMATELSQISIKAKTNEKMGWIGRGEGLAAHAVVLISSIT